MTMAAHLAIHYTSKNTPTPANEGQNPRKGSIICTAFPMAPIYSATKHGVIGLVRSLAPRLEKEHIQINALAPAVIGKPSFLFSFFFFCLRGYI